MGALLAVASEYAEAQTKISYKKFQKVCKEKMEDPDVSLEEKSSFEKKSYEDIMLHHLSIDFDKLNKIMPKYLVVMEMFEKMLVHWP